MKPLIYECELRKLNTSLPHKLVVNIGKKLRFLIIESFGHEETKNCLVCYQYFVRKRSIRFQTESAPHNSYFPFTFRRSLAPEPAAFAFPVGVGPQGLLQSMPSLAYAPGRVLYRQAQRVEQHDLRRTRLRAPPARMLDGSSRGPHFTSAEEMFDNYRHASQPVYFRGGDIQAELTVPYSFPSRREGSLDGDDDERLVFSNDDEVYEPPLLSGKVNVPDRGEREF